MKYIWEEEDFNGKSGKWGLMASCNDELVIVGGQRATSLRDGHSWPYKSYKEMAEDFNKHEYIPVLAQINPSVIIRQAEKKRFNYGGS